jgi:hypothetical protein
MLCIFQNERWAALAAGLAGKIPQHEYRPEIVTTMALGHPQMI